MQSDIDRVLISQDRIARRVQELADQITRDHTEPAAGRPDESGAEVTIVPVLTGAMIFCADLIRHIPIAMKMCEHMCCACPAEGAIFEYARAAGRPRAAWAGSSYE